MGDAYLDEKGVQTHFHVPTHAILKTHVQHVTLAPDLFYFALLITLLTIPFTKCSVYL